MFVRFISWSIELKSIVYTWILKHWNWAIGETTIQIKRNEVRAKQWFWGEEKTGAYPIRAECRTNKHHTNNAESRDFSWVTMVEGKCFHLWRTPTILSYMYFNMLAILNVVICTFFFAAFIHKLKIHVNKHWIQDHG